MKKCLLTAIFAFFFLTNDLASDSFIKGRDYYLAGKYEIALITLLKAVDAQPENPDCYLFIGNIYTHKREFSKAIAYYKIGLDLTSRPGIFHFNLGQALYYGGSYSEALTSLKRALDHDSRLVDSWLEQGRAWYQLENRTNTIASWKRYLVEAPENPQAETIQRAIELLSATNFMFPSQKQELIAQERQAEEERRQAIRDRLAELLAQQNPAKTGDSSSGDSRDQASEGQGGSPSLSAKDISTQVKDVDTKSKDRADYDKGQEIED